jgi:hypothetical protein
VEFADRAKPDDCQFVVLLHTMPAQADRPTHWDFMLDLGGKLLTFELRELPHKAWQVAREGPAEGPSQPPSQPASQPPSRTRLSMLRLVDHRRLYLQYQGELSRDPVSGEERGSVRRVAAGRLHIISNVSAANARVENAGVENASVKIGSVKIGSVENGSATQRYLLRAPELEADLEFSLCDVGHTTQLIIHHWCWLGSEVS